jgi:hypothetical protein
MFRMLIWLAGPLVAYFVFSVLLEVAAATAGGNVTP